MSQRLKSGDNAPRFAVEALEPDRPVPRSPRIWSVRLAPGCAFELVVLRLPLALASPSVGVAQPARCACTPNAVFGPRRSASFSAASSDPIRSVPLYAFGVAQPARNT